MPLFDYIGLLLGAHRVCLDLQALYRVLERASDLHRVATVIEADTRHRGREGRLANPKPST